MSKIILAIYTQVRIILGTYKLPEYFSIYEMRLEYFGWFVIPTIQSM